MPKAKFVVEVFPLKAGHIKTIDSDEMGIASMILGAGRENLEDEIDCASGIYLLKKIGDCVQIDEPMAIFYTNDEKSIEEAKERFLGSLHLSDEEVPSPQLIKAIISKDGVKKI